jgi:hypothetical protein
MFRSLKQRITKLKPTITKSNSSLIGLLFFIRKFAEEKDKVPISFGINVNIKTDSHIGEK